MNEAAKETVVVYSLAAAACVVIFSILGLVIASLHFTLVR